MRNAIACKSAKMPAAESYSKADMMKSGVQFHKMTPDALAEVIEMAGHQRPEYDDFKINAYNNKN